MKYFSSLCTFLLLSFCGFGQTTVTDDIDVNTTWTLSGSPYTLDGDIQVEANVTLTINPGVTVIFPDEDTQLIVFGSVQAIGTSAQRIQMVGDLANDIHGGGIVIQGFDQTSTFNHVNFQKLGSEEAFAAITIGSFYYGFMMDVVISNSEIHDTEGVAIYSAIFNSITVTNSCFYNIGFIFGGVPLAIYNINYAVAIEANNCFWGSPNGPNQTGGVGFVGNVIADTYLSTCDLSSNKDVGILNIVDPGSGCDLGTSEEVSVEVTNYGNTTESFFPVAYTFEGTEFQEIFNDDLEPGEIKVHNFTTPVDLSTQGEYTIEAYTLLPGDSNSGNDSDEKTIEHLPPLDIEITATEDICQNDQFCVQVPFGVNYQYQWSNGETSFFFCEFATTTQTYSVTVTDNFGCTGVAEKTVVVNPIPAQPTIVASSTQICPGETVTLSTAPGNVEWSTGETSPSITITTPGTYFVAAYSDEGCVNFSQTIFIQGVGMPEIDPIGDGVLCIGESVTLTVNNVNFGSEYLWSTGETTSTINVTPTATTNYSVTITNQNCVLADDFTVVVEPDITPGPVSNLLPENGVSGLALPVAFSWAAADHAASYDVYIGLEGGALNYVGNTTQLAFSYSFLQFGNTYCWQIIPLSCNDTPGPASPIQCFTLEFLPDLVVEAINLPSSTAFAGTSIEVNWTLKNIGEMATPFTGWVDGIYLSENAILDPSDQFLGTVIFNQILDEGNAGNNSIAIDLPDCDIGDYFIIVVADLYNSLPEANEVNNTGISLMELEILSPPLPDLAIVSEPTIGVAGFAMAGETYNLSFQVQNQGDIPAGNSFAVRVFVSNDPVLNPFQADYITDVTISGPLDVGESTTLSPVPITLPEDLIEDEYFIHLDIDITNAVEECTFEGNNIATTAGFDVLPIPRPDLELLAVDIATNVASNKEYITIEYTLINNDAPLVDQYLLDKISLYEDPDGDILFDSYTLGENLSLANGITTMRALEVQMPYVYTGPLYAQIELNHEADILEFDYDNNTGPSDFLEVISPNLTPIELDAPSNLMAGQNFQVFWKDRNIGPGNLLNAGYQSEIYLSQDAAFDPNDDLVLGEEDFNLTLFADEEISRQVSVSIPNGTTPGEYYLFVEINSNFLAYENGLYDDNLIGFGPINIEAGEYPDLVAEMISSNSSNIEAGDLMNFSFEISNQGDNAAFGVWEDQIFICTCSSWDPNQADLIADIQHSQVVYENGDYETASSAVLSYFIDEGDYYLYLVADAKDDLFETDESNSSNIIRSANPFTVVAYDFENVDLSLENVVPPCDVLPGEMVSVSFDTKNIGSTPTVAGEWWDGVVLSTDNIWSPDTDTIIVAQWLHNSDLEEDDFYSNLKPFTLPTDLSGTYYVLLVTDLYQANNESNISNNAALLPQIDCMTGGGDDPITFPPKPDLVIDFLSVPNAGTAGQPIIIQYQVTNMGSTPATPGSWTDQFYLDLDTEISGSYILGETATTVDVLAPGESYTNELEVILPVSADNGNYFLLAQTDAFGALAEDLENNNTNYKFLFIEYPEPSDLLVTAINYVPLDTIATEMTVSWTLSNIGAHIAEGIMHQSVYLSEDPFWDVGDFLLGTESFFVNLEPDQSFDFQLNGRIEFVEEGLHYILVRTDAQNNIIEQDENNNLSSSFGQVYIEVPEIVINAPPTSGIAEPELPLFYRIEVPAGLNGESLRINLESDELTAFNEMFVSFDTVPTRTVYDFGFTVPFVSDQEIIVPELQEGTYYVLVYAVEGSAAQDIDLSAEIIPFEFISIVANEGGNTGQMTTKITGGKFIESMSIWLENANGNTIFPENVIILNPVLAYATFDLLDAELGIYDLKGERTDPIFEATALANAFTIVEGTIGNVEDPLVSDCLLDFGDGNLINLNIEEESTVLELEKFHPASVRPGRVVEVTLRYTNVGNIDVPIPQRLLSSSNGIPLSFEFEDFESLLQELNLTFSFEVGPNELPFIPPGEQVSRKFYVKAEGEPGDIIRISILKL